MRQGFRSSVVRPLIWLLLLVLPLGNCVCSSHVFKGDAKRRLSLVTTLEAARESGESAEGTLVAWAGLWDGEWGTDRSGRSTLRCRYYELAPEVSAVLRDAWTFKELVIPEGAATPTGRTFYVSLPADMAVYEENFRGHFADRIVVWPGVLWRRADLQPEWVVHYEHIVPIPVVVEAGAEAPFMRGRQRR